MTIKQRAKAAAEEIRLGRSCSETFDEFEAKAIIIIARHFEGCVEGDGKDKARLDWSEATQTRAVEYWNDETGFSCWDWSRKGRKYHGKGPTARAAIDAAMDAGKGK